MHGIEIESLHLGYHHGQHDLALVARSEGAGIARLSYTEFEGEISVSMIEVDPQWRRLGIGSRLLESLQARHPQAPIQFGYLTESGSALLGSLHWNTVENPVHRQAAEELARVRETLSLYRRRADALADATEGEKADFIAQTSDWNDLNELEDRLSETVMTEPSEFRLIRFDSDTNYPVLTPGS